MASDRSAPWEDPPGAFPPEIMGISRGSVSVVTERTTSKQARNTIHPELSAATVLRARLSKVRAEPHAVQRYLCRKAFPVFERLGVHVVGDHFYEPVPNLSEIRAAYDDGARPCHGIAIDRDRSERHLIDLLTKWGPSFAADAEPFGFTHRNLTYAGVDAMALYAIIRETRPSTIVEIGQGVSTTVLLAGLDANTRAGGERPRLVTIDPFLRINASLGSRSPNVDFEAHTVPVQRAPTALFSDLAPDSMLFIDSSHVHKWGSDVVTLFDDVLPQVAVGTNVHIHDIYTPFDYPREWYLDARRFWNEQFVMEAFLRFNSSFEVTLPMTLLVRESAALAELWPKISHLDGTDLEGSSFYLRRTA